MHFSVGFFSFLPFYLKVFKRHHQANKRRFGHGAAGAVTWYGDHVIWLPLASCHLLLLWLQLVTSGHAVCVCVSVAVFLYHKCLNQINAKGTKAKLAVNTRRETWPMLMISHIRFSSGPTRPLCLLYTVYTIYSIYTYLSDYVDIVKGFVLTCSCCLLPAAMCRLRRVADIAKQDFHATRHLTKYG